MVSTVNLPAPLTFKDNVEAHCKTFKQNLEIYMIASGNNAKTDTVKIALLLNIVGQDKDRQKYAKVIQAFEEHTTPKKNEVYERYVFDQRNQVEGEPIDQYIIDLKKLAKTCEFDDLEDFLIWDRIVHITKGKLTVTGGLDITSNISLPDITKKQTTRNTNATRESNRTSKFRRKNHNGRFSVSRLLKPIKKEVTLSEFVNKNPEMFEGLRKFPGTYTIQIRKGCNWLMKFRKEKSNRKGRKSKSEHCINRLVTAEKPNSELRFCLDP
ncbi:hypothetical protein PR048_003571 [Dryococelus australis]|uniref:Retrotransposon gag domain-containing protein n=1 Tax=Dryococelus australis TaxID=614101 RepID=A0ABQ9INI4_9NEOP|nr:hypothetical protein PR048_003571 [Dryococelus australis]